MVVSFKRARRDGEGRLTFCLGAKSGLGLWTRTGTRPRGLCALISDEWGGWWRKTKGS